jgi:hypothetical protein
LPSKDPAFKNKKEQTQLRAKEIMSFEKLFEDILKRKYIIEDGVKIVNSIYNNKDFVAKVIDIYNIEKQKHSGGNFTTATRLEALQAWYKKEASLPGTTLNEYSDNTIGDEKIVIDNAEIKLPKIIKLFKKTTNENIKKESVSKNSKQENTDFHEVELKSREITALETLFDDILKRKHNIENGIKIINHLSSLKNYMSEVIDIYNIEKQKHSGGNFTTATRLEALQT